MPGNRDTRIITPMSSELVQAIDDFRFNQRLPSRSEAIRRLIEAGLKAYGRDSGDHKPQQDQLGATSG